VCWLKAVSYQQLKLAALVCFAFIPSKILFVSAEAFDTEKQFCVIFFFQFFVHFLKRLVFRIPKANFSATVLS
jgi:hypothetical protein